MIQSKRWFPFACLSFVLSGSVMSIVGVVLGGQMNAIAARGVEATATVTGLATYTSGSRNSRSTSYRVAMDLDFGGQAIELVTDTDRATWQGLSKGDPVAILYVPDGSGLCYLGNRQEAAGVADLAKLVGQIGLGSFAVGGSVFAWAWLSLGMPTLREWFTENLPAAPANPYAAA